MGILRIEAVLPVGLFASGSGDRDAPETEPSRPSLFEGGNRESATFTVLTSTFRVFIRVTLNSVI